MANTVSVERPAFEIDLLLFLLPATGILPDPVHNHGENRAGDMLGLSVVQTHVSGRLRGILNVYLVAVVEYFSWQAAPAPNPIIRKVLLCTCSQHRPANLLQTAGLCVE